jgi:import receptor subunit TOM22
MTQHNENDDDQYVDDNTAHTDVESEYSDDEHELINETLLQRIYALTDVIPHETRFKAKRNIVHLGKNLWSVTKLAGNAVWVLTTSAFILVFPLAYQMEREAQVSQWEKPNPEAQKMLAPK